MYNGKPAAVFFFSSSGGRTEAAKNVWGNDFPYLQSVEDSYETGKSYNYTWEKTYTADKIKEVMTQKGINLGNILNMQVTKRSEAGRATELVITGSYVTSGANSQKTYLRSGTRDIFSLPSQWYDITTDADLSVKTANAQSTSMNPGGKYIATAGGVKLVGTNSSLTVVGSNGVKKVIPSAPTTYKFTGRGWGHAIGMSQEGARGMANAGFKYDQILTHYFPGTQIQ
jgi:stage II sporulation protein D